MRARGLLVALVGLVALLAGPSPASAAANTLSSPGVSPASGSTTTVFVFGVRYDGRFPATGISVQVAGRTLPMSLVAGTPVAGSWRASTRLPAGGWPVSFQATVEQGNAPSLAGPSVRVTAQPPPTPAPTAPSAPAPTPPPPLTQVPTPAPAATQPPPAAPTVAPGAGTSSSPSDHSGITPTEPAVQPVSTTPARPVSAHPTARPSVTTDGSVPADSPPGSVDPGPGEAGESALVTDAGGGPSSAPAGDAALAGGRSSGDGSDQAGADDSLLTGVLLVGLAGVAAVALIAAAMLLASRRAPSPQPGPVPDDGGTAATRERRARRRSQARLDGDDPIVAAMGIGTGAASGRPRPGAGQTHRGAGERPTTGSPRENSLEGRPPGPLERVDSHADG